MSNSKMLIDAAHPEETRVVVLKGNRIEEFDFESASKKQLRGNIYLAKVTRVEPSLQAAFVEYGGNRHGFLAFSEIHPDYYQIPFADRQALLEEEARAHRDEDDEPRESRGGEGRSNEGRSGEGRGGEGRGDRNGRRGGEGRSGRGESRGDREPRADKENGEAGEKSVERSAREGRGDRDGRGGREGRGERGQRRSRRHRRDNAPATALDRRGPADESISEPAFEADDVVTAAAVDQDAAVSMDAAAESGESARLDADAEAHDGAVALGTDDAVADERVSTAEGEPATGADETTADDGAPRSEIAAVEAQGAEPPASDVDVVAAEAPAEDAAETVTAAAEESYVAEAHADDAPHAGEAPHEDEAADVEPAVGSDLADGGAAPADPVAEEAEVVPAEARDADEARAPEGDGAEHEEEHVEQIGGDALSDVAPRPVRLRRHYKIQEVIKRRQILLIQVVKEERGNKGAALTTYLSLAGRYSVLMPNTAKGGGISRKITDGEDRKRLKAIAGELDVPEGMGVILRTAGASRSPIEVRRDFEYLLRMWESVRELTLKSSAPTLVYEEGSLIKRSIRDLYSKEVEEVVVSGEAGFAEARDFMRMLMPGNVKAVQEYRDPQPIFAKSGVEAQLDAMFSAHVTLKSGGYLVINQTEALVAIDVNSGRSTREHNIEDTALRTNMEAADEVARQLRLRDLAGLIVVDFIDMEEGRNNRAVERRIKEALKNDRARIQIGRISHFGLLEMSRQRIRTGVLEGSTVVCPHCAGAGTVRSTASIALHVLRLVEDALIKDAAYDLVVRSRGEVALYMLNQKRAKLVELEQRFGVTITVEGDPALTGMVYHAIERGELATPAEAPAPRQDLVRVDSIAPIFEPGSEFEDEAVEPAAEEVEAESDAGSEGGETASADAAEGGERRRKRRRRRRGRDRDDAGEVSGDAAQPSDEGLAAAAEIDGDVAPEPLPAIGFSAEPDGTDAVDAEATVGLADDAVPAEAATADTARVDAAVPDAVPVESPASPVEAEAPVVEEAPKRRRSRRTAVRVEDEAAPAAEPEATVEEAPKRRRRPSRARDAEVEATPAVEAAREEEPVGARPSADRDVGADTVEHHAPADDAAVTAAPAESTVDTLATAADAAPDAASAEPQPDQPKRSGWWQRAKSSFGA
ncbi:Rne/Rng family ribonuclease [Lichenibacterium minor]|uniref:Ribonuclease E n=1 Tax=Lichenibacterium minor TaxID=2316528 RepID=A0A4Q2UAN1_9HYPH|nr:Rne/Rng family ribonuclease [Lichenibacterium minor]RYC33028.1 Rne/Rng family ribonuclease [Lichenibacterium minor]